MLASVSKTFVAVAATQAVDAGQLNLDADVNTYLPFSVRNPRFATVPITMRQLLTHTSSIDDTDALLAAVVDGDSTVSLQSWLSSYLVPNGANYSAAVYANARPGTKFKYSNEAVALAGYVIERAVGMPFDQYTQLKIFAPLGMTETSWHLAGLDVGHIAVPYDLQMPVTHYGYPDYPNGELRASAAQLGKFLSMMTQDGVYGGTRLVEAASVSAMLKLQVPSVENTQGLIWYYFDRAPGHLVGHDGEDRGVHTVMAFRRSDAVGAIVLTNGYASDTGMLAIFDRLFAEAASL